jgi:hypothetical protein
MPKLMIYEIAVNDAIVIDGRPTPLANQHKVIPMVACPRKGAPHILEECLTCVLCGEIETRFMYCDWAGPDKQADAPKPSEPKQ